MFSLLMDWLENCSISLLHITTSHCTRGFRSILEIRKDFAYCENTFTANNRNGNISKWDQNMSLFNLVKTLKSYQLVYAIISSHPIILLIKQTKMVTLHIFMWENTCTLVEKKLILKIPDMQIPNYTFFFLSFSPSTT